MVTITDARLNEIFMKANITDEEQHLLSISHRACRSILLLRNVQCRSQKIILKQHATHILILTNKIRNLAVQRTTAWAFAFTGWIAVAVLITF